MGPSPPRRSCSTLSALGALSAPGVLRTKCWILSSFPALDSSLPPPSPLCTGSADSEERRLLRGDPAPCQAQVAGGLGNPRTQCMRQGGQQDEGVSGVRVSSRCLGPSAESRGMRRNYCRSWETWVAVPALPLTYCMVTGRSGPSLGLSFPSINERMY